MSVWETHNAQYLSISLLKDTDSGVYYLTDDLESQRSLNSFYSVFNLAVRSSNTSSELSRGLSCSNFDWLNDYIEYNHFKILWSL